MRQFITVAADIAGNALKILSLAAAAGRRLTKCGRPSVRLPYMALEREYARLRSTEWLREISNGQGASIDVPTPMRMPAQSGPPFCHPELLLVSPIFKGRRREWRNNITIGSQFVSPPPDAVEPLPRRFAHRSLQRFPQNKGPRLLLPVLGGTDKINCAQGAGGRRECLRLERVVCRVHPVSTPVRVADPLLCIVFNAEPHFKGATSIWEAWGP